MSQRTVTINGTVYDAHTGMPVTSSTAPKNPQPIPKPQTAKKPHSQTIHRVTQKSQTLNRRVVKKSVEPIRKTSAGKPQIKKSPAITKFAPHPKGIRPQRTVSDIGPVNHPIAAKAQKQQQSITAQKQAKKQLASAAPKPSGVIKQEAIAEAIQKAPRHNAQHKQHKTKKYPRALGIASAGLALLLLGGYFTYLNMPNLSVRVAAAQAGVNASYPDYRPDGYSLNGPVAFADGKVVMKFAANAGPQGFSIAQEKSNWDSSAVLDNYVKEKAGDNYITYNERGLTIYTFGGDAAWVNGGILYTINGDAPLSSDQIRRIATSL